MLVFTEFFQLGVKQYRGPRARVLFINLKSPTEFLSTL